MQQDHPESMLALCEALWSSRSPEEALACIEILSETIEQHHHSESYQRLAHNNDHRRELLRYNPHIEIENPSDVFLALQGAELRFRASTTSAEVDHPNDASEDEEVNEKRSEDAITLLREAVLTAVATLARVCVGPAWWSQIQERIERKQQDMGVERNVASADAYQGHSQHQSTLPSPSRLQPASPASPLTSRLPETVVYGDSPVWEDATWSPLSQRSYNKQPLVHTAPLHRHPHIPEVLLAAMIRFAASMLPSRRNSILRAQVSLVMSLCCRPSSVDDINDRDRGIAPKWHIPGVQEPLSRMFVSWLQRAVADWSTKHPTEDNHAPHDDPSNTWDLRFHLLRACNDLLSAGWSPRQADADAFFPVLLQVAAAVTQLVDRVQAVDENAELNDDASVDDLGPILACGAEAVSILTCMGSREMIPHDSLPSLVDTVIELQAAFQWMRNQLTLPCLDDRMTHKNDKGMTTVVADDLDGCIADIEDLFWFLLAQDATVVECMDLLMQNISRCNFTSPLRPRHFDADPKGNCESRLCRRAKAAIRIICDACWDSGGDLSRLPLLRTYWLPFLEEIIDLLERLVAKTENMNQSSPDADLTALGTEILLALGRAIESVSNSNGAIQFSELEWETVIKSLERAVLPWLKAGKLGQDAATFFLRLSRGVDFMTMYASISFVGYEHLVELCLILLRKVVPWMESSRQETIGLSAIRCWSKFGFSPFRLENWVDTASDILTEAFRVSGPGVFDHSTRVRLAGLISITRDDQAEPYAAAQSEQALSLLVLLQHTRDQYLQLVGSILPILQTIFAWPDIFELASAIEASSLDMASQSYAEAMGIRFDMMSPITDFTELACYAVKLAGRLFRADSGHNVHREKIISLLLSVANDDSWCKNHASDINHLRGIPYRVRLDGILELEACLISCFTSLPQAHAFVPIIVEALRSVFAKYALNSASFSAPTLVVEIVLAITSLAPLARVRVAIDGRVALIPRLASELPDNVTNILLTFYKASATYSQSGVVEVHGAPALSVAPCSTPESAQYKTILAVDGILESALRFLQMPTTHIAQHTDGSRFSLSCLRVSCMAIMRHHCLVCTPPNFSIDVARSVLSSSVLEGSCMDEFEVSGLALLQFSQSVVIASRRELIDNARHLQQMLVLDMVLQVFEAPSILECNIGSNGLCSLIPSLVSASPENRIYIDKISASVRNVLANGCRTRELDETGANRTLATFRILHDIFAMGSSDTIPVDVCRLVLKLLARQAMTSGWKPENQCFSLGMLFLPRLLSALGADQLQYASVTLRDASSNNMYAKGVMGLIDGVKHQRRLSCGKLRHHSPALSNFERLFRTEQLVRHFEYDTTSRNSRAAWLINGDSLLTCRIGATHSMYADSVELLFRSQTSRMRLVLSIRDGCVLQDPGFLIPPIGLDSMARTANMTGTLQTYSMPKETAAVIARFEKLMALSDTVSGLPTPSDDSYHGPSFHIDKFTTDVDRWLASVINTVNMHSLLSARIHSFLLVDCGVATDKQSLADADMCALNYDESLNRAIDVLDRAPPLHTLKVALLYDQSANHEGSLFDGGIHMLGMRACSPAFHEFANGLGKLVPTKDLIGFSSGGLDTSNHETDGKFALLYTDVDKSKSLAASTCIIYHVVSLMPKAEPWNTNRKRHVGNDFVIIVFSDEGSAAVGRHDHQDGDLIGGAFGLVIIFVSIVKSGVYIVNVRIRDRMINGKRDNNILSSFVNDYSIAAEDGPVFVRNLAVRADMACRALTGSPDAVPNIVYRKQLLQDLKRHASVKLVSATGGELKH